MIDENLPVRVYWNYKHHCYSLFQKGAVRASAIEILLENVEFRVRETGRQRMIRENRKIIHAYAEGYLIDHVHPSESRTMASLDGRTIFYNPYKYATFVEAESCAAVLRADEVYCGPDGLIYRNRQQLAA